MALIEASCNGCMYDQWRFIKNFHSDSDNFIEYLQAHGVLPKGVICPECDEPCSYRSDRHQFYCGRYRKIPKKKLKKQCSYSVSLYKGTFLDRTHLPPWEIGLFINHWLDKSFKHSTIFKCLHWSRHTSVDWRSFCSEVTVNWLHNQDPIGGPGIIVEIDETFFCKRKYGRGRMLSDVWLFGGIERVSKRKFIIPLHKKGQDRSAKTLIPLIKKYIRSGSTIISDGWAAYGSLSNEGYSHRVINHSENFVHPEDRSVHTQTVERLWRNVKEWAKRPGMRSAYFEQYFGRYLFLDFYSDNSHHHFFLEAARLYKPLGNQELPQGFDFPATDDELEDSEVSDSDTN